MSEKKWTLTLNKYQRDNLLWLINACGWPDPADRVVEPFPLANTGDWIGEVGWMLQTEGEMWPLITEEDRPNISFDELRARVHRWMSLHDSSR